MYWQFNHQSSPQIETVLAKEDLTLSEVLDQENILQELKNPNTKLIEFITRNDILDELITLIIEEPSEEIDEQERYRRSNLACEVLTTDIPRLNESLSDFSLLTKLYSFLKQEPPLNPLLASFFSRTLSLLICRKSDQNWYSYQFTCLTVIDFLKSRENSLKLLLKHLGTSAIMDLTLKLITQVEGDAMQQNLVDWLESEELIQSIIELFHPRIDSDRQSNAAQLLCDSIRKFREREINPKENPKPESMLEAIQSPEMIKLLLEQMLDTGGISESSIAGGISVLLTLLEPPTTESPGRRNPYTNDEQPVSVDVNKSTNPALSSIVLAIVPHLPKLHNLLINPPKKTPFRLACGVIDPPLGNTRLTVIKLIAALISTQTPEVNEKLDELNTVQVLLDLFFQYTWNNFLHSQVDKCLAFALNSSVPDSKDQNPLISNIFIKCRLLQRILEAWEANETEQGSGGKRKGYMGHLINIANSVSKQANENLGVFLKENIDGEVMTKWEEFVEKSLKPVNEIQSRFLGGVHPSQISQKDEMEFSIPVTFDSKSNPNSSGLQRSDNSSYSNSWKNVVENFAGLFTLADREEKEEMSSPEDQVRRMMFEQMCSDRRSVNPDMDNSDDKEAWESEDTSKTVTKRGAGDVDFYLDDEEVWEDLPTSVWNNEDARSSSEDEEDKPIQEKMESIWSGPIAEPVDPWGNGGLDNAESGGDGWANFDAVEFNPSSDDANMPSQPTDHQSVPELAREIVDSVCRELENNLGNPTEKEIIVNSEAPPDSVLTKVPEIPPVERNAAGDDCDATLDSKSDNNANLTSLTDEPSPTKELYSRICSTKNKVNDNCDDVPKSIENTPIVTKSSDR
uniref:Serine/threonine-protein phosphatase 6 regulatory subunit 3 n=2 Tax=Lygus hesperus TaxID=30085 RepID=A0A0A9XKM4_LYGHE